mmetsp:Transcript_3243/g.8291  ORF Transcript_3243/g.8291 Transcript_3243/m.8291 type:complete len:246 (+) Transcript_3243:1750-2487(+)
MTDLMVTALSALNSMDEAEWICASGCDAIATLRNDSRWEWIWTTDLRRGSRTRAPLPMTARSMTRKSMRPVVLSTDSRMSAEARSHRLSACASSCASMTRKAPLLVPLLLVRDCCSAAACSLATAWAKRLVGSRLLLRDRLPTSPLASPERAWLVLLSLSSKSPLSIGLVWARAKVLAGDALLVLLPNGRTGREGLGVGFADDGLRGTRPPPPRWRARRGRDSFSAFPTCPLLERPSYAMSCAGT